MTRKFAGFYPAKAPLTSLPAAFFSDLLPLIDDLGELKLTLFCFRALYQKEGKYRYLRQRDFATDAALTAGLSAAGAALDDALRRAVARGTLLTAETQINAQIERLYFMNTEQGREAVRQLEAGTWQADELGSIIEILPEQPNIYRLYQENIGMVSSPIEADRLKEIEREYPAVWVADAIKEAVLNNQRSLRYIERTLKRWAEKGKDHATDRRYSDESTAEAERRIAGKLSDFSER
jgi:DNA replication protein